MNAYCVFFCFAQMLEGTKFRSIFIQCTPPRKRKLVRARDYDRAVVDGVVLSWVLGARVSLAYVGPIFTCSLLHLLDKLDKL